MDRKLSSTFKIDLALYNNVGSVWARIFYQEKWF